MNEILDMTDSVNKKSVSLRSAYFAFMMNPNRYKKYRYIGILSNILEFLSKVIFSTNQVHAVGHFYDKKPHKLGVKQQMVTMYVRESHVFISDGLDYIPIILPTDE